MGWKHGWVGGGIGAVCLSVCLAVCLAVLLVVPTTVHAQSAAASPEVVELPDELDRVLRDYEQAWSAMDASALARLFTSDGFVMRPGQPPAQGQEAILRAYANAGGPLSLRAWQYRVDGDTGFIIGGYGIAPGSPAVGKFVLALRKEGTDRWLIAADIDNGN